MEKRPEDSYYLSGHQLQVFALSSAFALGSSILVGTVRYG